MPLETTTAKQVRLRRRRGRACSGLGWALAGGLGMVLAAGSDTLAAPPSRRVEGTAELLITQTPATREEAGRQLEQLIATAETLKRRGESGKAAETWERIVALVIQVLGPDHPRTASSLNNLAFLYSELGRYREAEALYKRALAIIEPAAAAHQPLLATTLGNLAEVHRLQGRYRDAEPLYRRALAIRERDPGPDHPATASLLNNLALWYQNQGLDREAEPLLRRALTIQERSSGPRHPLTAATLSNLALVLKRQGRPSEAEPLHRRALAINQEAFGAAAPQTATSLNNLASFQASQGRYGEAEVLYRKALAIKETSLGPDHPATAVSLNNLALLLHDQGRYGEAEPLQRRTLAIRERVLGPDHPETAESLNNVAGLLQDLGQASEAERLYRRALDIAARSLGADNLTTAQILNNLGLLTQEKAGWQQAEQLHRRALAIRETHLGPDHPATAESLNNLAGLLAAVGQGSEAEALQRRALRIQESALGAEHPGTATSLINLGALAESQGRAGEAERLFRRGLAINETALGPQHPNTATALNNLARLQLRLGQPTSAAPLLARLTRSQADWLRRELPLQPRDLRIQQLQAQPDAIASTFALLHQDPSTAPLALETRLNRQGLLAEIEQRQRLLAASSPQTRSIAERIAGLDRRLASVTLAPAQRQTIQAERRQLEADLTRLLPALRIDPVSTTQVAAALRSLAPGGLLIEFQRYRPLSPASSSPEPWGAPRYLALLLHPDGRVTSVPLGPAAPLDAAISAALAASAANLADAPLLWGRVSQLLLSPLQPHLRSAADLLLSPDGELHRIPFAVLPDPADPARLLIERHPLRLLTTGRDLLRFQTPSTPANPAVVMADPLYDASSPAAGGAPGGRTQGSRSSTSTTQQRSADSGASGPWRPLPATAAEASRIAPLLSAGTPITGPQATAARALALRSPRILHIATHGFFLPDQTPTTLSFPASATASATTSARSASAAGNTANPPEDPLLRSGLALAGANRPDADPADDGYLTAAEVTGIDLAGTQLVTLSACETGLGDLRSGEGVYGLQRALTVAGSRSTLLSLWKVEDEATAAFMVEFYTRLKAGVGTADALAATQAAFRSHPNPLFRDLTVWGAFQLTGDWRAMPHP